MSQRCSYLSHFNVKISHVVSVTNLHCKTRLGVNDVCGPIVYTAVTLRIFVYFCSSSRINETNTIHFHFFITYTINTIYTGAVIILSIGNILAGLFSKYTANDGNRDLVYSFIFTCIIFIKFPSN